MEKLTDKNLRQIIKNLKDLSQEVGINDDIMACALAIKVHEELLEARQILRARVGEWNPTIHEHLKKWDGGAQ